MKSISAAREKTNLSQRRLAHLARLSFRTIQLLESGKHDPKLSSLEGVAKALGYPAGEISKEVERIFRTPPDSIHMISERMVKEGVGSWKIWLFNFVDAFRREKSFQYIEAPPVAGLPPKLQALSASVVETLCDELSMEIPSWCVGIASLPSPWFVAGVENLKAMALLESPVHFRKRNIFVLSNFLERK